MLLRRSAALTGAALLTALAGAGVAAASPSDGRTIYGVTSNGNRLVSFPANSPGSAAVHPTAADPTGAITGLVGTSSERVVGIDFRPSDGVLFALTTDSVQGTGNSATSTGRLYTVNKSTAVATLVQTLGTQLSGAYFDIGFNPVANALRIVSSNGQNLRVPTGGTGTAVLDTPLGYPASGDAGSGKSPKVAAVDYTPAAGGATTLYDIDYVLDNLTVQGAVGGGTGSASPNAGVLTTVGPLDQDVNNLLGLDFESDGTGYVDAQVADPDTGGVSPGSTLFTLDTATGSLTPVGAISGDLLDSIAIDTATPAAAPSLPEFGVASLAPISALALGGGLLVIRRRRQSEA